MRRELWLGLILVLLVAAACGFFARVAPELSTSKDDSEWLRTRFNLNQQQVGQIETLQSAYMPRCMQMCARIRAANARVCELIESGPENEADLKAAIYESIKIESECRFSMIRHVYEVASVMPPPEAKRFLAEMAPHLADAPATESRGLTKSAGR